MGVGGSGWRTKTSSLETKVLRLKDFLREDLWLWLFTKDILQKVFLTDKHLIDACGDNIFLNDRDR